MTDINASKGAALNFLKKYWNLDDSQVLASGDQDNDIDLIKNAGVSVCVGSNSLELKKASTYFAKSVNSDELVDIVERFMF